MSSLKTSIRRVLVLSIAAVVLLLSAIVTLTGKWDSVFGFVGLSGISDETYVAVADVGNSDFIVLYSQGHCAVIDTGDVGDNGYTVVNFLKKRNIKTVDVLFITHPHSDHMGGLEAVLNNFSVNTAVLPDMTEGRDILCSDDLDRALSRSQTQRIQASEGKTFTVGEFELEVLMSLTDAKEENDRSVVITAEAYGRDFLFMGDAGEAAESELLSRYPRLEADVLKVGHHGSKTATSSSFVEAVKPEFAAISCGTQFEDVPSAEVIERLLDAGVQVNRTDINSDIIYFVNEEGICVETGR